MHANSSDHRSSQIFPAEDAGTKLRPLWVACLGLVYAICIAVTLLPTEGYAQFPFDPSNMTEEQREQMRERMQEWRERFENRGRRGGRRGEERQQEENDEDEDKDTKAEQEEETDDEEETPTIKRPTDSSMALDPNRQRLQPDESGRVQFNYHGEPWAAVLQDYADAAGLSFDWQELPADNLNLTTQRKYTLPEARDMLNRLLLARGFTLLSQGEVLTAVKIDKLDPSLIPSVEPDNLEDYAPYEFVRARFSLPPEMEPDKAGEDVKVLLSPNGKVTPLLATRRLLVIDAVSNLRSVRDLLYSERMATMSDAKPQIYFIRHRRADYIADQVMVILGMNPETREEPQETQLSRDQMRMFQQMQRGNDDNGQNIAALLGRDQPKVYLAVNQKQNSILVNSPPEYMPIIDRTIKQLDVPDNHQRLAEPGQQVMKKYKTTVLSTEALITALQDIGNLDPMTQLQSDPESKTLFAYATDRDHEIIARLIEDLDGSGRKTEVVWLPKRLPADQVAGSIQELIVGPQEEEEDDSPFYYYRRRRGRDNSDNESATKGFRVLPDIDNNRLLLWANEAEMREVRDLIEKLEYNPNAPRVRRFDARSVEETRRLLEELQSNWTGENPLEIEMPPEESAPEQRSRDRERPLPENRPTPEEDTQQEETKEEDRLTSSSPVRYMLVQQTREADSEEESITVEQPEKSAPIKITVNEDGQITIASEDTEALDRLQEILEEIAPSAPEFHRFKLDYVEVSSVRSRLEEYFADELAEDDSRRRWWEPEPDEAPSSLGNRPPLRFIDDSITNTLIVANANPSQLRVIEDLVSLYDVPRDPKHYYSRKTEVVKVHYSRASDIAASLKEVYRDLLSSLDEEFQGRDGNQLIFKDSFPYIFGGASPSQDGDQSPVLIQFEGALSIGVDEVSNTLIISAREELLDSIKETINVLDEAAKPNTVVQVHEIQGTLTPETLKAVLGQTLGEPWPGGKPLSATTSRAAAGQRDNGRQQNRNQRDRGNRGRRGRGRR